MSKAINSEVTKEVTDLIAEQLAQRRFERRLENFTNKQIRTLLLFSQNYSLPVIAEKEGVCTEAIRGRLETLSRRHRTEFNKALAIREVYKRDRDGIRATIIFSNLDGLTPNDDVNRTLLESISNITKRKF